MDIYAFPEAERNQLEKSTVPFVIYQFVDNKVVVVLISDGFCELCSCTRKVAEKLMNEDMYRDTHPDDKERVMADADKFVHEGGIYDTVYRTKSARDGKYHVIHSRGQNMYTKDGTCLSVIYYMYEGSYHETADYLQTNDFVKKHSAPHFRDMFFLNNYYDELTGLPNMSNFLNTALMEKETLLISNKRPAVISFNLNGLKMFNIKFGVEEGNKVLIAFADILRKHFGNEHSARFGEDHFYAVAGSEHLEEEVEQIFDEMRKINNGRSLTVRVGVYVYDREDEEKITDISAACDRARTACDSDRTTYDSILTWYDGDMGKAYRDRDYVVNNLERAIEYGYIKVYYQPQVRLLDGKVYGFEALARWDDPSYGTLSPMIFVPILEETNLTYKLDEFMVKQVIEDQKKRKDIGVELVPVSLNLSRTDFQTGDPAETIPKLIKKNNLTPDLFKVEITESTVMSDPEGIRKAVMKFHSAGIEVLMDDFGSGYSSLATLLDLEFDGIKIDMGFMRKFSERTKKIILPIISMAKNLGIHTLMEGVETEEQLEFLSSAGCEVVQGYYYGRPTHISELDTLITTNNLVGETREECRFYNEIGIVDVINRPIAFLFFDKKSFTPVFMSREFQESASHTGYEADEAVQRILNEDGDVFFRLARKAIKSGNEERISGLLNGRYFNFTLEVVAKNEDGIMLISRLNDYIFHENNTMSDFYKEFMGRMKEVGLKDPKLNKMFRSITSKKS